MFNRGFEEDKRSEFNQGLLLSGLKFLAAVIAVHGAIDIFAVTF
jgi:hypothetical protein